MQNLVGKNIGTYDDVHLHGWEYSAIMLWNNEGLVHNGPDGLGFCLVAYVGEYLVEKFMIPVKLLEVVE